MFVTRFEFYFACSEYAAKNVVDPVQAKQRGFPDSRHHIPKWQKVHQEAWSKLGSYSVRSKPTADDLYLHLPRLRDAWDILSAKHGQDSELVADLSQTVTRASDRTDGTLPTVTPRGIVAVRSLGRVVSPLEKLLLHCLPVHRMVFPVDISDQDISQMAGNTMHVQVVASAILFALSFVDWTMAEAMGPWQPVMPVCMDLVPRSKVHGPQDLDVKGPRPGSKNVSKVHRKKLHGQTAKVQKSKRCKAGKKMISKIEEGLPSSILTCLARRFGLMHCKAGKTLFQKKTMSKRRCQRTALNCFRSEAVN